MRFHSERQDTSSPGWQHLLALIEEAAADGREVFRPLAEMSPRERRQVVTLPPSIAKLTAVKQFILYGSNLVRLPPEIGAMTSLQEFTPYNGNEKLRPPFPALQPGHVEGADLSLDDVDPGEWGTTAIRRCSVCDQSLEGARIHQAWISLRVATDVLPLLVNACSAACLQALPEPPEDYVQTPHAGGPGLAQPTADYA